MPNLKGANIVEIAKLVLGKLYAEQKHSFEEIKKEIAEWTLCLDKNKALYQGISEGLQKSEFNAKSTEMVVANAREAIAKTQALLEKNEQVLALE